MASAEKFQQRTALRVVISAGEQSGDQRASEVVRHLRRSNPHIEIRGLGGKHLEAEGVSLDVDARVVGGVMGFFEVFSSLKRLRGALKSLIAVMDTWKPDVVVLVDFPDFNLRVARQARKRGIPTVYYIPPKVWAWRRDRIRLLDRYIDRTLSIFPFEKAFHSRHGYARTTYVGHPLAGELHEVNCEERQRCRELVLKDISVTQDGEDNCTSQLLCAILPGSRRSEISRHLPIIIEAFSCVTPSLSSLHGVIAVPEHLRSYAQSLLPTNVQKCISFTNIDSITLMKAAFCGVLKSGTCNLEAALLQLPHIVIYKVSPLTAAIVRKVVRITQFSPVNILRPSSVPELLQENCSVPSLVEHITTLVSSSEVRDAQRSAFQEVRGSLLSPEIHSALPPMSTPAERVAHLIKYSAKNPEKFDPLSRRVFKYLAPYKLQFVGALFAMTLFGATDGAVPFVAKYALDNVLSGSDRRYLYFFPTLLISLSLIRAVGDFFQQFLNARIGHLIIRDIRNDMSAKVLRLPPSYFVDQASGDILSRVTSDVLLLRMLLTDSVAAVVRDSIRVVALTIAALSMDPFLALIAVTGFPLAVYPIYQFGRRMRSLSRRGQDAIGAVSNVLSEVMSGSRVIKVFTGEQREQSRFTDLNENLTKTFIRSERVRALTGPVSEMFASIAISAVVLYGGASVMAHTRTQGQFIAFIVAVFLLYDPFKRLSRVSTAVQQGLAGAQRIFEVLDAPEVIHESESPSPFPDVTDIEFKNVSFSYLGIHGKRVVDNVSLHIYPGECLAVVGFSGSGKTTLVDLLPRFIDPTEGSIEIGGVSVKNLSLHELRGKIAMVSQHTFLFNDTVYANIAYGMEGASEAEVHDAARKASALSFIQALPLGFLTRVGEGGHSLSGGERQRIAIARAMLKNAPILILDEATASLDNQSEREVQNALEKLQLGRTTLIIAHRLSSIQSAHRVVVMKEGRIVEQGTPSSLLESKGEYASLYFGS
jgi:ATP-binding cassette, subfamily B, bacterial MsbA